MKVLDLKDCSILLTGHQLLAVPVILDEQKEKSGIIKPAEFTKKINGETHTIVRDDGKVHLLKVLNISDALIKSYDIKVGDYIRIAPTMIDYLIDPLLTNIKGDKEPLCIVSYTQVLAILRKGE